MAEKTVKVEALSRMLDMIRPEDEMESDDDKPNAVLCQVCGHMVDTKTGEDLGPAVDMSEDVEFSDEATVYDDDASEA